jgi:ArsR family transcriptional regulator, arsenate/arsenite/antimonite-responsive transcriptional repressor
MKNLMDECRVLQIAKVLGDPVRFSIYRHILETDEVRCGDICVKTPVRASTTSHHLKMLSDAGLIESRREGQGVYYRSAPSTLRSFVWFLWALQHKEASPNIKTNKRQTARSTPKRKARRTVLSPVAADLI